jgi:hypothetical protein
MCGLSELGGWGLGHQPRLPGHGMANAGRRSGRGKCGGCSKLPGPYREAPFLLSGASGDM